MLQQKGWSLDGFPFRLTEMVFIKTVKMENYVFSKNGVFLDEQDVPEVFMMFVYWPSNMNTLSHTYVSIFFLSYSSFSVCHIKKINFPGTNKSKSFYITHKYPQKSLFAFRDLNSGFIFYIISIFTSLCDP